MRTRRRQQKSVWKIILFFIFIFFMFYQVTYQLLVLRKKSVLIDPTDTSQSQVLSDTSVDDGTLRGVVAEALAGTQGSYGIVIKHLQTGETFVWHEHQVFEPGSLYKLWVMGTVFAQIQNGTLTEDQEIHQDVQVLNEKFKIASESAELVDGSIDFTVASALKQMITISHNYAALLLTEKVRLSTVATFLEKHGLKESHTGGKDASPTTTAADIALFLEKLDQGKLANETYTEAMISLLKKQQLNNKLPKYLPEDIAVAHKTGEIAAFTHDAGIVYSPTGKYIIVVLSKSDEPDLAEERIAELSKRVFNYFNQKQ